MKTKLFLIYGIIISLFIISFVSAETEIYKLNQETNLKFTCTLNNAIPSASAQYNITLSYPNGSTFLNNVATTPLGNGAFYYTTNFTELGLYKVQMFCYDGTYSFSNEGFYEITGNGKPTPAGSIIVLFSIIFIITVFFVGYLALYSIGHFITLDFDLLDLAKNWGMYFVIIVLYFLQDFYLGNNAIGDWLLILIEFGGALLVIVPIFAFIMSITFGTLKRKKMAEQRVPFGRRR